MALIYYVEDDASIAYIIEKTLDNAGHENKGFKKGEDFLRALKDAMPDLILLDVMLPDISGLDILKAIRKTNSDVPIMMVSALQSEMDKVIALDLGADDYLTKPFGVLELTSRIQAKIRKQKDDFLYQIGNVVLDEKKHVIQINQAEVYFTNKEFLILKLLMRNQSVVVSKEEIFKHVWETDYIGETRTLDMHIKAIREKLHANQANFMIQTIRGIGYQIR